MDDLELAYKHGTSFFHRMSPFSKTLYIVGVSFIAIFNSSLLVGAALAAFTLLCAALSRVGFKAYWTFGKVLLPFIVTLMIVFPFFYGGQVTTGSAEIAIRTPIKDLSWAALGFGALLGMRFVALAVSGLTFAFTTRPNRPGAELLATRA